METLFNSTVLRVFVGWLLMSAAVAQPDSLVERYRSLVGDDAPRWVEKLRTGEPLRFTMLDETGEPIGETRVDNPYAPQSPDALQQIAGIAEAAFKRIERPGSEDLAHLVFGFRYADSDGNTRIVRGILQRRAAGEAWDSVAEAMSRAAGGLPRARFAFEPGAADVNRTAGAPPQRSSGAARDSRPERPARPARPERPDRPERPERPERPARPERPERPERPDRPARPDRPEMPQRPARPGR